MKTSKFVRVILVAFVAVGLVAPQQAGAVPMGDIRITSPPNVTGANITQSGNETTVTFVNPLHVGFASGIFSGAMGLDATFSSITYTGTGNSATLVGGTINPLWSVSPDPSIFYVFALEQLTFASSTPAFSTLSLNGTGFGTIHDPTVGFVNFTATFDLLVAPPSPPRDFQVLAITIAPINPSVPDGGSTLGLLAIGLVAVEGLRRKIATRQNRYT